MNKSHTEYVLSILEMLIDAGYSFTLHDNSISFNQGKDTDIWLETMFKGHRLLNVSGLRMFYL